MSNAFWHGFADMNAISTNGPLVMTKGEGSWVWDDKGKKYFDAAGALWYMNVGHGRKEIGEAMAAQAADIASYSSFGECTTAPTIELADLVASISPVPDSKIFFTSGGSDSIDTALKMSRRFWTLQGKPSKKVIVFRENGYHGMHAGGTSIAGIPPNNDGYSELVEDVVRVPWDDADEMIATIDRIGEENIAAFFCEPIQGAGGVRIPPDLYLQTVRKACAERNILFVPVVGHIDGAAIARLGGIGNAIDRALAPALAQKGAHFVAPANVALVAQVGLHLPVGQGGVAVLFAGDDGV